MEYHLSSTHVQFGHVLTQLLLLTAMCNPSFSVMRNSISNKT